MAEDPWIRVGKDQGGSTLFFALVPDAATRVRLVEGAKTLRRRAGDDGRWIAPARYHVTLRFLGRVQSVPDPLVDAARRAASRVAVPGFDLVFDRAGRFDEGRVDWLGCAACAGMQHLHAALEQALMAEGVQAEDGRRFAPHLTLRRGGRGALLEAGLTPISWRIGGFVLLQGGPGARGGYRALGRWPLPA